VVNIEAMSMPEFIGCLVLQKLEKANSVPSHFYGNPTELSRVEQYGFQEFKLLNLEWYCTDLK